MIIAQDMIIFSDFSSIHHVLGTGRVDVEEFWMSASLSPKAPWGTEAGNLPLSVSTLLSGLQCETAGFLSCWGSRLLLVK